ncbi:hypothetical protein PGQ11_010723 [Apiospora arundinis]|uniref:Metalloprotease n=1 Tax=Apiospora arundinis TaxID=335852 RepID=A0ABR2IAH5_9PEZI
MVNPTLAVFAASSLFTNVLIVNAFSIPAEVAASLAARNGADIEFKDSCNTKYGGVTAKEMIEKAIEFAPKVAEAGAKGLDIPIKNYKGTLTDAEKKKPDYDRTIKTFQALFWPVPPAGPNACKGKPAPNTKPSPKRLELANRLEKIQASLQRLKATSPSKPPPIIIHCDDTYWMTENEANKDENKGKVKQAKPNKTLGKGKKWYYDTDRNEWLDRSQGPCDNAKAGMTLINDDAAQKAGLKERMTFCPAFLKVQQGRTALWDLKKNDLPDKCTNSKGETRDWDIKCFSNLIGRNYLHEFMHTRTFYDEKNYFKDQNWPEGQSSTKAYEWDPAHGLAEADTKKSIADTVATKNIDTITLWSLAMYYSDYEWHNGGKPKKIGGSRPSTPTTPGKKSTSPPPPGKKNSKRQGIYSSA